MAAHCELSDYLNKEKFHQLINSGVYTFYNPNNGDLDSFHWVTDSPFFSIVIRDIDTAFVSTNKSSVTVSGNTHALYRLFNLWQIGDLK